MYSIITATESFEFTDCDDLLRFITKSTFEHFIVEFSKDTDKGENRIYYPQDIYDPDNDHCATCGDIGWVELALIDLFEKKHKRVTLKPTEP
jgi:hypothetical protein